MVEEIKKSEYEIQAEDFLKKTNTEFKAEFVEFNKYFADDEKKRAIFNITLKRGERSFTFPFGQSIVESGFCLPKYTKEFNEELFNKAFSYSFVNATGTPKDIKTIEQRFLFLAQNRLGSLHNVEVYKLSFPNAYDVLAGLQKCEVGTFKDFCNEFGYSDDSIKAEKVFKAVQKEFEMVRQLWSDEEIKLLQEIN